jgi:predicted acylesterase/phospholipase RssA
VPRAARRRPSGRRLGLALAGGGPEGAVYEIGALRALEESIEGLDLNRLDIYVGVSAGAFIAAGLANGVSTAQMVRGLVKHEPGEHPFEPHIFFTPNYREWARRGLQLPKLVAGALRHLVGPSADQDFFESLTRLARALPVGIFDGEPLRRYLENTFALNGRTDDFRRLRRKLVVVVTDLASGHPIRFGEPGWDHIPISVAVQASCALPGIYPPVRIEGHDCVDGVLLRTVHASVALEDGADLLVCVNPLVPADLSDGSTTLTGLHPTSGPAGDGTIMKRGLPTVLSQTFRMIIHSRLQVGMSAYAKRFPDADVLLFEPARDEYRMFFTNIFSWAARRKVCALAYDSTRRHLLQRRAELEPVLARHGLRLRADLLRDSTRTVWDGSGLVERELAPVSARLRKALAALEARR